MLCVVSILFDQLCFVRRSLVWFFIYLFYLFIYFSENDRGNTCFNEILRLWLLLFAYNSSESQNPFVENAVQYAVAAAYAIFDKNKKDVLHKLLLQGTFWCFAW